MKYLITSLFLLSLITACTSNKNGVPNHDRPHPEEYVKGEIIVVFKNENTYQTTIKDLEKNNGVELIDMLMVSPPDAIIGHFKVPQGKEKEMITIFQKHSEVKSAELNIIGSYNTKTPNDNADDFIKGKLESIENGKDGYTAKIKTTEGKIYFATISIPNLGRENAHQYRTVSVGEIIEIKGEMWSMGDEQRITVRTMKPAENK